MIHLNKSFRNRDMGQNGRKYVKKVDILDLCKLGICQKTLQMIRNDSGDENWHNFLLNHTNKSVRSREVGQKGRKYIKKEAILDLCKLGICQKTLQMIRKDSRDGNWHNCLLKCLNKSFRSRDMGGNGRKYIKWQPSWIYANYANCPRVPGRHPVESDSGPCTDQETSKKPWTYLIAWFSPWQLDYLLYQCT